MRYAYGALLVSYSPPQHLPFLNANEVITSLFILPSPPPSVYLGDVRGANLTNTYYSGMVFRGRRYLKMANKDSRSGGKYSGNHTTLVHAAALVCDIAHQCPSVTKISPGFIKSGLPSANGQRRVKILDEDGGILLSVRDNTSHQQVHIYATDVQKAKLAIARGARDNGLRISFKKKGE